MEQLRGDLMSSIYRTLQSIAQRHQSYLEATYHIRHPRLIGERRAAMSEPNTIVSEAFLEAPPRYNPSTQRYGDSSALEGPVAEVLTRFAENNHGVFDPPYAHQMEALEAFFGEELDVVVTTGTGSGKTEVFTNAILGRAALEGMIPPSEDGSVPAPSTQQGLRTLILYPMNALVSDQLTRIRQLFNIHPNETGSIARDVLQEFRPYTDRPFRFAMYTSRTPYHGTFDEGKNDQSVKPIVDLFNNAQGTEIGNNLESHGKIPQKNLIGFRNFGRAREDAYRPQPDDTEYLTRQEMLDEDSRGMGGGTPDLLITNYSMLEYILLRPIEQPLLDDTQTWLRDNPDEKLLIVMDEAHLYRGSGGAEVALLLRRLLGRLRIGPERARFILTSASFSGNAVEFASQLTGKDASHWHHQTAEPVQYATPQVTGTEAQMDALVNFGESIGTEAEPTMPHIEPLAGVFDWGSEDEDEPPQEYLGRWMNQTPLFQTFADMLLRPTRIDELSQILFPGMPPNSANEAVLQLGNLASMSRLVVNGTPQPLLPTRVHTIYSGLPKHYICTNSSCSVRRVEDGNAHLGRLYFSPQQRCACGAQTLELVTCRECGTAYLKAHARQQQFDSFVAGTTTEVHLWNESADGELLNLHLYPVPQGSEPDGTIVFLEPQTGVLTQHHQEGRLPVLLPEHQMIRDGGQVWRSYRHCLACNKQVSHGRNSRMQIQDLETKGSQPFSNIIADVFDHQPRLTLSEEEGRRRPNQGRKILAFSDSRQKAAKLARSLQQDIEQDAFRAAVVSACMTELEDGETYTIDQVTLATGVYSAKNNLRFFKNALRIAYNDQMIRYQTSIAEEEMYDVPLHEEMEYFLRLHPVDNAAPPLRMGMLRTLSDPYYSLTKLLIGYVSPTDTSMSIFLRRCQGVPGGEELLTLVVHNILQRALDNYCVFNNLRFFQRDDVRRTPRNEPSKPRGLQPDHTATRSNVSPFSPQIKMFLENEHGWSGDHFNLVIRALVRSLLFHELLDSVLEHATHDQRERSAGNIVINPEHVNLVLDQNVEHWRHCPSCLKTSHQSQAFGQRCPHCLEDGLIAVDANDPYFEMHYRHHRNDLLDRATDSGDVLLMRSEEHTAQVNERDIYHGQAFSPAERYELEFQDLRISELQRANGSPLFQDDQPVDMLSCTTTMEVGIDIGSLTAVAMRTIPPRPDNYQQRSGRAGRRGSSLSTIVSYANNSPHEQHYFTNPHELIGRDPVDPTLQIDNLKLSQRHMNALFVQFYFTDVVRPAAANQNVFESLGVAGEFFDRGSPDPSHCPAFQIWLTGLVPGDPYFDQAANLVPEEIQTRFDPQGEHGDAWRPAYVHQSIDVLNDAMEFHLARFMGYREDYEDYVPDENQTLIKYLLTEALLPSFAFPLHVTTFGVLGRSPRGRWTETYTPSVPVRQALSQYTPGRKIVVDKKEYQSAGLYVPFPSDYEQPFQEEIEDIDRWVVHCSECGAFESFEAQPELDLHECTNHECGATNNVLPMYTPKGFAPIVKNGRNSKVINSKADEMFHPSSDVMLPMSVRYDQCEGTRVGEHGYLINQRDEEFYMVNNGPTFDWVDDEGETQDGEEEHGVDGRGWTFCSACGSSMDMNNRAGNGRHYKVYPRITYSMNGEDVTVPHTCSVDEPVRLSLGYRFTTDSVTLRVPLLMDVIRSDDISANGVLFSAAMSAKEALLNAIFRGNIPDLDLDSSEVDGHFRILWSDDAEFWSQFSEDQQLGYVLEIFLFDNASGGAGFAERIGHSMDQVLDRAIEMCIENCDCDTSCHRCLRSYQNRYHHKSLNRHLGGSLLNYIAYGDAPELDEGRANDLFGTYLLPQLVRHNPDVGADNLGEGLFRVGAGGEPFHVRVSHALGVVEEEEHVVHVHDVELQRNLPDVVSRILEG